MIAQVAAARGPGRSLGPCFAASLRSISGRQSRAMSSGGITQVQIARSAPHEYRPVYSSPRKRKTGRMLELALR